MRSSGKRQECGTAGYWTLPISVRRSAEVSRCSKNLILLMFLAPRPGLEPGTYGLTVDRSIYPQTGMNAVPSELSYPISLACFAPAAPGGGHP